MYIFIYVFIEMFILKYINKKSKCDFFFYIPSIQEGALWCIYVLYIYIRFVYTKKWFILEKKFGEFEAYIFFFYIVTNMFWILSIKAIKKKFKFYS